MHFRLVKAPQEVESLMGEVKIDLIIIDNYLLFLPRLRCSRGRISNGKGQNRLDNSRKYFAIFASSKMLPREDL